MTNIIIGNIIMLIAALLMVYSGLIKKTKKVIFVQNIQIGLTIISNIVLNGITGAIVNTLSLVRNILFYYNKLTKIFKIIISLITIVLCIVFNNLGIIGYLPLIATLSYIWLIDTPNPINFKLLNIFTLILWTIYDLYILSFTGAIFDVGTIITNIIGIIRINKK